MAYEDLYLLITVANQASVVEGLGHLRTRRVAVMAAGSGASLAVKEVLNPKRPDIRTPARELEGFRTAQTMNLNPEAVADLHLK